MQRLTRSRHLKKVLLNLDLTLKRGEFATAEKYFRKAIKRLTRRNPNPYDGEAHYNLGVVLQEQKSLEEAMACYQKALAIRPDFAAAHNNLGNVFREQKKTAEADVRLDNRGRPVEDGETRRQGAREDLL